MAQPANKPKAPLGFKECLQLTSLGIKQDVIKFKNVTLQSSKYVCVREEGGQPSLAIIEIATRNLMRLPVPVDSAIMNPITKVVALRAQNNLQIYNLEMKTKMKTTTLENVVFWKWLDPKTIAIVTDKSCYHWSMDGNEEPKKMFDRAAYEGAVQVINYASSTDQKWLMVSGIAAGQGGAVSGVLQVFSVDAGASQPTMDSHAATFASATIDGREAPSNLFCFTQKSDAGYKLNIIEVGVPREQAFKQSTVVNFQPADFPVAVVSDDRFGCLFVISKGGFMSVHEIQSGKCVFSNQASKTTMFANVNHLETGIISIDLSGRIVHFYVDEANIIPYINQVLNDVELGVKMAQRYNLPGAEALFIQQFQRLMQAQRFNEAMQLAVASPKGILRTADTINQFKAMPANALGGNSPPLLQYFSLLLKKGKLNSIESLELVRPVLAKGAVSHVENWLKEDKLECTEDLGELCQKTDIKLALMVYVKAKVPEKIIGCFLALGAKEQDTETALNFFQKIFQYSKQNNFTPDYPLLVAQLHRISPDRAKDFAILLLRSEESAQAVNIDTLTDIFMRGSDVKNATNILLEYLKGRGDREEDGPLQTKVLEINLMTMPQVAEAIMESDDYKFTHFDRQRIAQLCERAQLFQRALDLFSDLDDIKRVLGNSHLINPEFLLNYFGRLTPENCLECLRDMLRYNMQQNIRLVVEVAKKYSDYLTPAKLVALFEEFNSYNGLFFYLGASVNFTEDPDVIFKYIQAAVKLGQLKEVERICRDNEKYNAKQVKEYLLEQNLKDPRPLIHVCDRHDFVEELTNYLYSHQMFPFIEAYVQRMNAKALPAVLGALLDLNANEDQLRNMISSVRAPVDDPDFVTRLVEHVEKRNRLKLLQNWLEARATEGSSDPSVHNGLGKIYVDTNNNPQNFLTTNRFYDSHVVGKYCEGRDPHLAFIAYKRAWGECDKELIEVTNKHGFFKDQARYLVERQDLNLWESVLGEKNEHRRQLIDQVVATALPESKVPEEVSTTVKAFMAANLPNELIELLERIILHGPSDGVFRNNKNLQNLLILTAIKADKKRVMDYINRLDNYDGPDIAKIAVSEQYQLFEEAFFIYKKFKKGAEAVQVLLDNIDSIERATEFAEYWNQPDVWSLLAKAQLDNNMPKESIASYLKAQDPSQWQEVINSAKAGGFFANLIDFLLMARQKVKDPVVDNELLYSYAKTNRLADMEEFVNQPNSSKIEAVGDLCYGEKLYEAARVLYNHINNNAKLAMALVKLELFSEAVDAARKANAIPTWKVVCFSCVDADKFRLAQICGLNIIVYNDHLLELIQHYEVGGHFDELITLLEQGVNLDRAHQGIFTQLGILYCKYKEDKLMEHIRLFWSRLNIPTLLHHCKENLHWPETVFLYTHYDQFDNAVDVMITHSSDCWTHDRFKDILVKVSNTEIYYRAIDFYLKEHPLILNDLLLDLSAKLDHSRVVNLVRFANHLPLVKKYLLHVQNENVVAVNEAVNQLCLDEEDYKALRESIDLHDKFDQIALAQRVENHELIEFRRISAYLYKLNKRWDKSIDLSKKDQLWADAMETAAESKDAEQAEKLLRFFVDRDLKECFAASLFTCYELIRPDVVLELSWRFKLMDFAMPFMIQTMREYDDKLNDLNKKFDDFTKKGDDKKADTPNDSSAFNHPLPLAIMPPVGYPGAPMQMPTMPPMAPMGYPPQPGYYPGQNPF